MRGGGTADLPGRSETGLVYGLFFLSGASALIYEISWSRQIGLLFGHTVHAAAIVIASYFAGMAVGSALAARWGSRVLPLLGYGIAELVASAWACLIPLLLVTLETGATAQLLNAPSPALQTTARVAISFALLFPATVAMGATLPLIAQHLSPRDGRHSRRISVAYALNTLGAMVGVLATTGYLLVALGVRSSSYFGAGVSTLCGVVACAVVFRRRRRSQPWVAGSTDAIKAAASPTRSPPWTAIVALSGFATLGLEVLYSRLFGLIFHNSTYTFGAVVAVFLAALAVGALAASRTRSSLAAIRLATWGSLLGAIGVVVSVLCFVQLTRLEYFIAGDTFVEYLLGGLGIVTLVVFAPIALLGVVLPAAWQAAGFTGVAGAAIVGRLAAASTLAATAGSLLASFGFLPAIGLWRALGLFSVIACLPAALLLLHARRRYEALFVVFLIAAIAITSDVHLQGVTTAQFDEGEELVSHWESPYAWIDVVRETSTGHLSLRENIHYRHGSTGPSATVQYRQGHLPLLMHQDPKVVLFLGLGTGLTASSALLHPEVERVDVVELVAEVVEAARLFEEFNGNVVADPKITIHIDDARHHLLATNRKYDVIISDLFVPWISKAGYLYTLEHFRAARDRLKSGGLFCLWLGLYQVGATDFEAIADSFASVFPETGVWWGKVSSKQGMVILVGGEHTLQLDASTMAERLRHLQRSSRVADVYLETAENVFRLYIGKWSVRSSDRLNTDEHPRVEFSSPIQTRDAEGLSSTTLSDYFDAVLAKLPQGAVQFRAARGRVLESVEERRAAARWILRR